MKKIIYTLLGLTLLLISSCDSYLDRNPDERTTLDSPEKIKELLVSAYPEGCYGAFCYAMADNLVYKDNIGQYMRNNDEGYRWAEFTGTTQDSPNNYWTSCYYAIANANQALEYITENHISGGVVDKQYLPYYGEALVARAYSHFMLSCIFCEAYDPNTASAKLGVPYVTKPEKKVLVDYHRETLAKTYELIEKDLTEGIKYIDNSAYDVPAYHFNEAASNAFASRFYLYKGEWEKVIKYANNVLSSNPELQLRDMLGYYKSLGLNEVSAEYSKASEKANLMLISCMSSYFDYYIAVGKYGMTRDLLETLQQDLFVRGDWFYQSASYGDNLFVQKWGPYFKRINPNSDIGYYYVMFPAFEIEEVLLNRAEALTMLGRDQEAIDDINHLLNKRLLDSTTDPANVDNINAFYTEPGYTLMPFYYNQITNAPLLNCIVDLRRKELLYTGHRWFDIKRFNLPVYHKMADGTTDTLQPEDPRKAVQIPASALQYGIKANPR